MWFFCWLSYRETVLYIKVNKSPLKKYQKITSIKSLWIQIAMLCILIFNVLCSTRLTDQSCIHRKKHKQWMSLLLLCCAAGCCMSPLHCMYVQYISKIRVAKPVHLAQHWPGFPSLCPETTGLCLPKHRAHLDTSIRHTDQVRILKKNEELLPQTA